MPGSKKGEMSGSEFEVDSQDLHLQSQIKSLRRVDSIRVGVTVLALLMGLTILGVSADTVNSYNSTHVSYDFLLPLWPDEFDLRPTVALVVGATLVVIMNCLSLAASKVQSVSLTPSCQNKSRPPTSWFDTVDTQLIFSISSVNALPFTPPSCLWLPLSA